MKTRTTAIITWLFIISIASFIFSVSIGWNLNITGYVTVIDVAPKSFTFIEPETITRTAAENAIIEAEKDIEKLKTLNIGITLAQDSLKEAKTYLQEENFLEVLKRTQLIKYIQKESELFIDKKTLQLKEQEKAKSEGINTEETERLLNEAFTALKEEQLEEAKTLLEASRITLLNAEKEKSRIAELTQLGKNFLLRYWWQVLLATILIIISSTLITKRLRKKHLQKKLVNLKAEKTKLQEYIKRLQQLCFVEKKITTGSYKTKVDKHEERIAEIEHTIPVLQAEIAGKKETKKTKKKNVILEITR